MSTQPARNWDALLKTSTSQKPKETAQVDDEAASVPDISLSGDVVEALANLSVAQQEPLPSFAIRESHRPAAGWRSRPVALAGGALAIVLLAAGGFFLLRKSDAPSRPLASAEIHAPQVAAPVVSNPVAIETPAKVAVAAKPTPAIKLPDSKPPEGKARETARPVPAPPQRQFSPPPLTSRPAATIAERAALPDLPAANQAPTVAAALVSIPNPVGRLPEPPKPVVAAPAPRVGGNLQAATLKKRVAPQYPSLARSMRVEGTVKFRVFIGKTGTVTGVQVLSGPPMLVGAATVAVKQWIYQPAMLNGTPVEAETQIDVNFTSR